jgi:hypothetical protein
VKLAGIEDNMDIRSSGRAMKEKDAKRVEKYTERVEKYRRAWQYLAALRSDDRE